MVMSSSDPSPKKKPAISTSSIFANARASSRNYTKEQPGAHTTTLTCRGCGAPRRDGDTSLICAFCGGHMTKPGGDEG